MLDYFQHATQENRKGERRGRCSVNASDSGVAVSAPLSTYPVAGVRGGMEGEGTPLKVNLLRPGRSGEVWALSPELNLSSQVLEVEKKIEKVLHV